MGLVYVNPAEILLIRCVKKREILVQDIHIFLLKNISVLRIHLIAFVIIFTVLRHFVNKEQRQRFNTS